ncbi:MAG: signal peptidase I [candidate division Zixibacteria bacterium]|nr:signal peptidase I [candidate division Zixibacteria bacterium]
MENDFLIKEHQQIESQRAARQFLNRKERKPLWREYLETAIVALVAAVLLRLFVVSAYRVNSGSMEDTLMTGDYIFVNKLAYQYGTAPQPGDIIVFKYPNNLEQDYIKRIVAIGGQTIQIADKVVYVDNAVATIPTHAKNIDKRSIPGDLSFRDNVAPFVVPEGTFFVMGDNRDDSKDSRFWGTVPNEYIRGKAVFIYWSWEPDSNPPGWGFPYIVDLIQWIGHGMYNFPTHVRWDRILTPITD